MNKDQWIQKAKVLLFDCVFICGSDRVRAELLEHITQGGGYDMMTESAKTPLLWRVDP